MRFEEVTHRFAEAKIEISGNPTHHANGKIVSDALPGLAGLRIWQARLGGYSWVISYDPGIETWSDQEKRDWIGYTASYRLEGQTGSNNIIKIDGGWDSFTKAEEACRRVWKQIRCPS